jgi:putative ABC transport system ATP-binding protein
VELRLEDVWVIYRGPTGDYPALRGVSLEAGPGGVTAVYGPSGSGKTTLLMVAATLLRPSRGEVYFDGRPLSAMSRGEVLGLRRRMGIAFQEPVLIPSLTLLENVEFSLLAGGADPSEYMDRVRGLAEELGIERLLGKKPGQISGGEARRAHLLMALAHDPEVLLLDEPTAYLDEESTRRVLRLVEREARRGKTVIITTHDPEVAGISTRTYRLSYGVLRGAI